MGDLFIWFLDSVEFFFFLMLVLLRRTSLSGHLLSPLFQSSLHYYYKFSFDHLKAVFLSVTCGWLMASVPPRLDDSVELIDLDSVEVNVDI